MNSREADRLTRQYKINRDSKSREQLIAEVSSFIIHYPYHVFGCKSRDANMDFYLVVLEQFENIIENFDSETCSFVTYLSTALSNIYINFISRAESIKTTTISSQDDNGSEERNPSLAEHPDMAADIDIIKEREECAGFFKAEKDWLIYIILKCYFFDFFEDEDIVILRDVSGKSYGECLKFIDGIMDSIQSSRERRLKLENLISRAHRKIIEIQRELFKLHNEYGAGSGEVGKIREKELVLRERQRVYLSRYHKVREFPDHDLIADFLGIARKQVANAITYFRKRSKTKLAAGAAMEN